MLEQSLTRGYDGEGVASKCARGSHKCRDKIGDFTRKAIDVIKSTTKEGEAGWAKKRGKQNKTDEACRCCVLLEISNEWVKCYHFNFSNEKCAPRTEQQKKDSQRKSQPTTISPFSNSCFTLLS
ncbi:unnamed protein product [Lepeophtheirus salmonis]|uniref:(salmon louse) hypothetical protein n=1 Tax=Lepeophtheirus salmonis TaxID=72036 RepID=A0A7R8D8K1_LEPSM|nr:unnamed protein product [Lepeophtheirus salmonis]CAF3037182.1 unnamed protein product [Lepeophtheirus salmonis]